MDLRMQKTRHQIKQAFLALRKRYLPKQIKVKDICEMAMINKTTFYNHYTDSLALSDEIDAAAIDGVLAHFEEKERLFESPRAYAIGLLQAIEKESAALLQVFHERQEELCAKLEERLRAFYADMTHKAEKNVFLSFAIGGLVRLASDYLSADARPRILEMVHAAADTMSSFL
jgi:AcrR family transcriptional regulator